MRFRQPGSKVDPIVNWIRITPGGGFIYGAIGRAQPEGTPAVTRTTEAVDVASAYGIE